MAMASRGGGYWRVKVVVVGGDGFPSSAGTKGEIVSVKRGDLEIDTGV